MSKIHEALNRIQAAKGTTGKRKKLSEVEDTEALNIARIIDRGTSADSYSVVDKVLSVDRQALRKAGLIAPEYHEQLIANQYRDIKRPLIKHAFGKRATQIDDGNLIMVSSALSGEGKTFMSINLALSMAQERDHAVLLVDADVAKPHTSDMFGAADEVGLLDALENPNLPVQSLILPTDVDNLSVLPAGRPRHNATELLASSAMEAVAATLGRLTEGQIVIFDSPPLLQTSEAKVLAGLAGQIAMVVRAEETSRDAVQAAIASLDQDKAINLILNQVRTGSDDQQYGYGYGYGNAYGQGFDQQYNKPQPAPANNQSGNPDRAGRSDIFE